MWTVGSRTQWNITKDFYVGVDVIYNKLNSAIDQQRPAVHSGVGRACHPAAERCCYSTADQDAVSVTWRVHRDIVP